MQVYSAEKIRAWDQFTIENEPVSSIDLMERAATACVEWLEEKFPFGKFCIFCGKGNNGGDGLAIARMLAIRNHPVSVYIPEFGHKGTEDFQANLAKLHQFPAVIIYFIQSEEHLPSVSKDNIIIDALFGTGLNRKLDGLNANVVRLINNSGCQVISIDMPSGMFADRSSDRTAIVKADHTLAFQTYKLAFLFAENEPYIGQVNILDIGLHPKFEKENDSDYYITDLDLIQKIYKKRKDFAHKGNFGHALLIAGSYGKIGAAILSAHACLRSGAGLLTCHIPKCGYEILQSSVPEAMVETDFNTSFNTGIDTDLKKYNAIGIGPGLGTASETKTMLKDILYNYKSPLVIDADALNILSTIPDYLSQLSPGSILTPHPKEFERLFGKAENDFERMELCLAKSKEYGVVIILKGHHTIIGLPDGQCFFNSTGNPGMATAGSGDVLTGILTGLIAQGYETRQAAILGVFLHGLAGDLAAKNFSKEAMIAGDLINHLGSAWLIIQG